MRDARIAQLAVLGALAVWGLVALDFEVDPLAAAVTLASALAAQLAGARLAGIAFDARSAAISGLSLTLLLRSDALGWHALAAALAIGSKFALRVRGKHFLNPTNFALVALLLTSEHVWVSPGQWGSGPLLAAALVAGACWVLRGARADATLAFLGAWCAILFGRALWLGDPLAIPLHQLESGALLLFAGFMLSDPRTLPDARPARIGFALAVAALAYVLRFRFFDPNALLYALAAASLFTPLLDALAPGARFAWLGSSADCSLIRENLDESHPTVSNAAPAARPDRGAALSARG
jgi:Na+-transporting NADH:ubiquinone oxidoreductase subunit NqrB